MVHKITEYYKSKGTILPQEEIDILADNITEKNFKKKEIIFKKGDTDTASYYIIEGCARIFINDKNGNEYNRFFAFDDWWIGEYHQIINKLPSVTSAQALEQTKVIMISREGIDTLLKHCPVFAKATLNNYLMSYAKRLEREEIKKTMTIEELYQDLLENRPETLNRVPLYHIASYLGVKSESLSRVKKKFKDSL